MWSYIIFTIYFPCALILTLSNNNCFAQPATGSRTNYSQSEECGFIEDDFKDVRTKAPWVAAIYARPSPKHRFKYLVTGTVLGTSTILTVFSGVYGVPRTKGGKYFLSPPANYKVGVGMLTNRLKDADEHSQMAEVSYILPYAGHEAYELEYHFFLFHLKTPLNLRTPYVRAACIPIFVKFFPQTLLAKTQVIYQTGFSVPAIPNGGNPMSVIKQTLGVQDRCGEIFKRFYKGTSENVLCSNVTDGTGTLACGHHGSAIVLPLFNNKWFMIGITALIPPISGEGGWCTQNTVNFYGRLVRAFDYLENNLKCGPHNFACGDGDCINLERLCDQQSDCVGGEDEDAIYCRARNPCIHDGKTHECGIYGECIRPELACDGTRNCFDGSDESPSTCGGAIAADARKKQDLLIGGPVDNGTWHLPPKCPPLESSEEVEIRCRDPVTFAATSCSRSILGTIANYRCQNYYKPVYRLPKTETRCSEDGTWKPQRPFGCEPDCGILPSDERMEAELVTFIVDGQRTTKLDAFPWHAAIFFRKRDQFVFICGGSLIEKTVILSAAHCVTDTTGLVRMKQNFRIAIGEVSGVYEDNEKNPNVQIFNVINMWVPLSYDRRNLQSDISIIELDKPAVFGDYVRPVCYYSQFGQALPSVGELGKVSGLGYLNDSNISRIAEHLMFTTFPVISNAECSRALKRIPPLSTFCAGYQNGTALCQGDSGGGMVFAELKGPATTRYILKGVVSHGEVIQGKLCNPKNYAVLTHVGAYADWIISRLDTLLK